MILDTEFDGNRNFVKARLYTIQAYFPSRELKIWKIWKYQSEQKLIQDFLKWFLSVSDKILIGYNLLKVDIPLLLIKSTECKQADAFFEKVNTCNIVDLHVILTFLNNGRIAGLEHWCKEFGVTYRLTIPSSQVNECMRKGDYRSVEDRIEMETEAIAKLHRRIRRSDRLEEALRILRETN